MKHSQYTDLMLTVCGVLIPVDSEQRLCKGINYFKEGSDPVLKPDSEYPEWLWEILDDSKTPLGDGDQPADMSDITLWRRNRKLQRRQENATRKKN